MRFTFPFAALAVLALLAITAIPACAAGDTGVYVAPKLSYNINSYSTMGVKGHGVNHGLNGGHDNSWGIGLAVGYDMFTNYMLPARVEVEGLYIGEAERAARTENLYGYNFDYSHRTNVKALFVNGYLDLHNSSTLTPYIGGGLGTSWIDSKGSINTASAGNNTETNFAWNVAIGLGVEINYNTSVDVGYRYASFGTAKTGLTPGGKFLQSDVADHQLQVGLRYSF